MAELFSIFKQTVDWLAQPQIFLPLAVVILALALFFYRVWTRPLVAFTLFVLFAAGYVTSAIDLNFRRIVAAPDNIPITLLLLGLMFFLWIAFRRAALNDKRISAGLPLLEESKDDLVLVWPDLVYTELLCMILATIALIVWAILVKAPLDQPANPAFAPNPAKAPWYFVGLQEMLVYFDPWMAGVVYPAMIIIGLMSLPFIDTNPKGNGYYTLRHRPMAISTWLFGFLILWVTLIFIGTFLRGPNWEIFGPFEPWNPNQQTAAANIDISQIFWVSIMHRVRPTAAANPVSWLPYWLVREWAGFMLVGGYLLFTPIVLRVTIFRRLYANMGRMRYAIMIFLLLFMALLPIKMVLRWVFHLKYFIYLPEFNANF